MESQSASSSNRRELPGLRPHLATILQPCRHRQPLPERPGACLLATMNMLIHVLRLLPVLCFLCASAPAVRAESPAPRPYEPSFETLSKITQELHQALDDKRRRLVSPDPQVLTAAKGFFLTPVSGEGSAPNAVAVSPTFVAGLNQLAHARALEPATSGYFAQYTLALPKDAAQPWESVGRTLPAEHAWNFDVMNHQASLFNQMAGTLIAIQMAHHYLGHAKKLPAGATDGANPAPTIAERVSEKEWREAVLKGAKNALDCGLGTEGFRALLGAAGMSSSRATWSACIVHPKADLTKLSRELEKLEKDFFLVGE